MTDEGTTRSPGDAKDIMIGGCHVRLAFGQTAGPRWFVSATVRCGIEENGGEQSLVTDAFDSRDAAERDAIQRVTALLGHHTDRSHSRVRNWN
jgi:hypothetical protein